MHNIYKRKILLAEDSPDDITIFRRAVRKQSRAIELVIVTDGEEALDFLYKRGQWVDVWTPDLLILNINMPKADGWDVFRRMREDPEIPVIPTVIWSVASMEKYNARAYEWGACGIFTKIVDSKDQERQLQTIFDYFFLANPYPRVERVHQEGK